MQYLTVWDLVLTPFYLLVLIFIARRYRDRNYRKGHPLRPYFLKGLYLKFFGVVFIALVYQYYYGGGDTFNFFEDAKLINATFSDSFTLWFKVILRTSQDSDPKIYHYTQYMAFYDDPPAHVVSVICAILGALNFTTYIPTALLFAFLSYTGIWAMYKTFADIYPHLVRPLAYAFLFVPTVFVWGSSIFKDTVCMFGLGWLLYTTFRIFLNKDFSIKNFLMMAFSIYLLAMIKIYILLAFIPALAFWLLITYSSRIRVRALRFIISLFVIAIVASSFFYFAKRFSTELNQYSLERIAKTVQSTRSWITYVSERDEGSKYDLGTIEGTPTGMLKKFFPAVNVTLFRPYLWEVRKPIMALSALESAAFLVLTIMVLKRNGLSVFRKITKDPNLLFFLVYSLIFAFAVGISTGNFGTLSRYKIPCIPFFAGLLVILYYQAAPHYKKITRENVS